MISPVRRFYGRFHLFTTLIPAYLTSVLVFISGWLAFHPPVSELSRIIEIVAGSFLVVICGGAFEFISRLGFRYLNWDKLLIKTTPEASALLTLALKPVGELDQNLRPALVDIGEVPLIMVGGFFPNQLWISSHLLGRLETSKLRLLICHERAHLAKDSLVDRVLLTGGYWWFSVLTVMLLVDNIFFAILWMLVAAGVFLRFNAALVRRIEKRADCSAAEQSGKSAYAQVLADYLAEYYGAVEHPGITSRLKGLDLSDEEIAQFISNRSQITGN